MPYIQTTKAFYRNADTGEIFAVEMFWAGQAQTLNFPDRFDIVWEKTLSSVAKQGFTMLYGKSQFKEVILHRIV